MHITQCQEQYSRAYVHAIACVAGYNCFNHEVDDDSIDIGISANLKQFPTAPKIEAQLKCHMMDSWDGDTFSFKLKLKNYNDLRPEIITVPRILVVVTVPKTRARWINHTAASLELFHCAYWCSLRGYPPTPNKTNINITIERSNIFNVVTLHKMMKSIGESGKL